MHFSEDELRHLLEQTNGKNSISLYMPTTGNPDGARGDRTLYKNLLARMEDELETLGEEDVTGLLEPAYDLLRDKPFWSRQSDGLALFLSGSYFQDFQLPVHFEPRALVGQSFHIKPLLPLACDKNRFFLLAMNKGEVRLYDCTRYSATEVPLEDIPADVEEAARVDDSSAPLQQHTGTGGADRTAMFHGQNRDDSARHEDVAKFCRQVDQAVCKATGQDATVIFCGPDRLFSIYSEVTGLKQLLDDNVSINPDGLSGDRLRDMSLPRMERIFKDNIERDRSRYLEQEPRGLTITETSEICPAAALSRVDTLFVSLHDEVWGRIDGNDVQTVTERRPGDMDLLDLACTRTLLTGGTVHALEREEMPAETDAAALLRYSI